METFTVRTSKQREIIDITAEVERAAAGSRIKEGICFIFVPHATAAVMLNEYEPNLEGDFLSFFDKIAPKGDYAHNRIDDNAEAHLLSSLFGQGKTLSIAAGSLIRGTWQNILLCEFDGPRERKVIVVCK